MNADQVFDWILQLVTNEEAIGKMVLGAISLLAAAIAWKGGKGGCKLAWWFTASLATALAARCQAIVRMVRPKLGEPAQAVLDGLDGLVLHDDAGMLRFAGCRIDTKAGTLKLAGDTASHEQDIAALLRPREMKAVLAKARSTLKRLQAELLEKRRLALADEVREAMVKQVAWNGGNGAVVLGGGGSCDPAPLVNSLDGTAMPIRRMPGKTMLRGNSGQPLTG